MPPRWSPGSAVRKEDQFTAAPDFIDPHDSEHMPLWGRLEASWHGMAPQRRVLVASSLVVFAGAIGALAVFSVMELSGGASGADQASQGLAAQPDETDSSLPTGVTAALNSTSPAPTPLPPLRPDP